MQCWQMLQKNEGTEFGRVAGVAGLPPVIISPFHVLRRKVQDWMAPVMSHFSFQWIQAARKASTTCCMDHRKNNIWDWL